MFDLMIRGGDVVTPEGVVRCDVAVAGETIAAIATPGTLSADTAKHVIDATGHIVMPGGIDPHVHLHHEWIKHDGTPLVTAGPEQVGRAALYGGTTTFIDFAYWRDGVSARQAIEARDTDFVGKSPCDWAYHIMLHSEPPPEFAGQLAEAIQAGYPTLKIFTTTILPSRSGRMVDFGDIWEAFQVLAKEGGLGVIHAEDNDIVMHMYAKLIREGRVGYEHLAEVDHAAAARGEDIGGEYLERRVAGLDRLGELAGEFGRRLGVQHEVVGPVAWAFPEEVLVAGLDGLERRDAIAPIGKIDERGRPAEQRGASDLLGAGGHERRAVGLDPHVMEMHVRIDAAWHDDMSCRVDQMLGGVCRQGSGSGDRGDRLAGDRDVAAHHTLGRHHIAVANNEIEHPASWRRQGLDA